MLHPDGAMCHTIPYLAILFTLNVIRYLLCGNSLVLPLCWNLIQGIKVKWSENYPSTDNAGKTQLVSFDRPDNLSVIDLKIGEFVPKESREQMK